MVGGVGDVSISILQRTNEFWEFCGEIDDYSLGFEIKSSEFSRLSATRSILSAVQCSTINCNSVCRFRWQKYEQQLLCIPQEISFTKLIFPFSIANHDHRNGALWCGWSWFSLRFVFIRCTMARFKQINLFLGTTVWKYKKWRKSIFHLLFIYFKEKIIVIEIYDSKCS